MGPRPGRPRGRWRCEDRANARDPAPGRFRLDAWPKSRVGRKGAGRGSQRLPWVARPGYAETARPGAPCLDGGRGFRLGTPGTRTPRPHPSRAALRVGAQFWEQNLDGDGAVETGVAGLVDLPHSACADEAQDFVGTEARARREAHAGHLRGALWRRAPSTTRGETPRAGGCAGRGRGATRGRRRRRL